RLGQLPKLTGPSDERRRSDRQFRPVERLQRRKRRITDLVDPLPLGQIPEPMVPKVVQVVRAGEIARRLGNQDLAAVACGRDPSGPMDVETDIALLGQQRLTRVHAHPYPDLTVERRLRLARGGERIRARAKATKNASPCVSTSTPPWRANASRSTR